jgi:hypothetical protein
MKKYLGIAERLKHMRHYNPARAAEPSSRHKAGLSASQGKMGGRTFGVQPLRFRGRVARGGVGWPGPEVLLSLLRLATLHYTKVTTFQEPDAF